MSDSSITSYPIQNISLSSSGCNMKSKDILLFKFLYAEGIDPNQVTSIHLKNFLHVWDPSYQIPSPEELNNSLATAAIDEIYKKNLEAKFSKYMFLITEEKQEIILAACLLQDEKNNFIFVDSCEVDKIVRIAVKANLEKFTDNCVLKIFNEYNVKLKYVIYNPIYELEYDGSICGIQYFRLKCIKNIGLYLRSLVSKCQVLLQHDRDVIDLQLYLSEVDALHKCFNEKEFKLNDAVEEILKMVIKCDAFLNKFPNIRTEIYDCLSPTSLACNYFNHQYRGRHFTHERYLTDKYYIFLRDCILDENLQIFCNASIRII